MRSLSWRIASRAALALVLLIAVFVLSGCVAIPWGPLDALVNPAAHKPPSGAWPMRRHDAQMTGRSPYAGPETPIPKWKFTIPGDSILRHPDGLIAAVMGRDGSVYAAQTEEPGFIALDPNGNQKWGNDLPARALAVGSDGTIYVQPVGFSIVAFDPAGTEKWQHYLGDQTTIAPVIGPDGTVYVRQQSHVSAIDPGGSVKWTVDMPGGSRSGVVLASDGTVYAGGLDGLTALNPDGSKRWTQSSENMALCRPAAVGPDGSVYVLGHDGKLHAANARGNEKWSFAIAADTYPGIASDGTIYVGGGNRLYALDPAGRQKWEFDAESPIDSAPIVDARGAVYFGSAERFFAVNPDGTKNWEMHWADCRYYTPEAIGSDGTLYVGFEATGTAKPGGLAAIGSAR